MTSRGSLLLTLLAISLSPARQTLGQTPVATADETIRVTVSLNNDGSRTVYQFDNAKHEATATTTEPDGKPRGKIVYQVADGGRFVSGMAYGPDDKFLFKSLYKYGAGGRLEQETHLAKDDSLMNRIVYKYDAKGKQGRLLRVRRERQINFWNCFARAGQDHTQASHCTRPLITCRASKKALRE